MYILGTRPFIRPDITAFLDLINDGIRLLHSDMVLQIMMHV